VTSPDGTSARELARRVSGTLDVALYWRAHDNATSVVLRHLLSGETIAFAVARDRALDAFYHPFAHLPVTVDLETEGAATAVLE
jgi:hypothetical protein